MLVFFFFKQKTAYEMRISDWSSDVCSSDLAMDALGELTRRYPESRYAADARLKMDLVRDHLAGKEMEIGRFYERTGQYIAAIIRYRKVTEEYDTTSHVPEALHRLVES